MLHNPPFPMPTPSPHQEGDTPQSSWKDRLAHIVGIGQLSVGAYGDVEDLIESERLTALEEGRVQGALKGERRRIIAQLRDEVKHEVRQEERRAIIGLIEPICEKLADIVVCTEPHESWTGPVNDENAKLSAAIALINSRK
jgi:hypothetical protein